MINCYADDAHEMSTLIIFMDKEEKSECRLLKLYWAH